MIDNDFVAKYPGDIRGYVSAKDHTTISFIQRQHNRLREALKGDPLVITERVKVNPAGLDSI